MGRAPGRGQLFNPPGPVPEGFRIAQPALSLSSLQELEKT